jgi:hypothetical protein
MVTLQKETGKKVHTRLDRDDCIDHTTFQDLMLTENLYFCRS